MWFDLLFFNEYFVAGLFLLLGVSFFIPLIARSFLHWKRTRKPRDFSNVVMAIWVFLFLAIPSYSLLLRNTNWFKFPASSVYFSLFNAFLFGMIFYLLVPKMAYFYTKFKSTSKAKDLGISIFLAVMTVYAFSLQLSLFLKPLIGRWSS